MAAELLLVPPSSFLQPRDRPSPVHYPEQDSTVRTSSKRDINSVGNVNEQKKTIFFS
jgi:hypothetical protein